MYLILTQRWTLEELQDLQEHSAMKEQDRDQVTNKTTFLLNPFIIRGCKILIIKNVNLNFNYTRIGDQY